MSDKTTEKYVIVGTVGTAFGVKGWVKVHSHTQPADNILDYDPWYLSTDQGWEKIESPEMRMQNDQVVAHFPGCDDRDVALRLTHRKVAIKRDQLPETAENEYYWSDLEGLTVINDTGEPLGVVDHFLETGANDVMVVKGEKMVLIPFLVGTTILNVDLNGGQIQVTWHEDE